MTKRCRPRPVVLHGDPDDPFVSPEDMIRILRLMGERDERKLNELRLLLEAYSTRVT